MAHENEMQDFMRQAQEITAQMRAASEQMARHEVVGTAADGAVRVAMTPTGDVSSVRIESRAVDLDDLPRLERHVAQAVQNALDNVRGVAEQLMRPLTDGLSRLGEE
ncbi:hypothetical protein GCM10022220_44840 [Actinocatenispora rupis]|uniref:Nucleoid-associated protein n=2 Tax=Actinocatenispora rupis TaxID=519421 RepID=A0A8J3J5A6_9ACTN|nr:hypothetical protein Aru02nite_59040 [Actinocatenispora rupis]